MAQPIKPTPKRYCAYCGKLMERKRFSTGELMSLLHFKRQMYCDRKCMVKAWTNRADQRPATARAGRARAAKRKQPGPCEICGKQNARDVHHKDKNTSNNAMENLQRVCRSCHNRIHRQAKPCTVCGKPSNGLGFCDMHYQRFKKWGDPNIVKMNQFTKAVREQDYKSRLCSVDGCGKIHHAHGFCNRHLMQQVRKQRRESGVSTGL